MSEDKHPLLSEDDVLESEVTFDVPNILLSAKIDNGSIVHSVREGRSEQVKMKTVTEWTETPVDERAQVFTIRARNVINFAQQRISVINDDTVLSEKHYPPSSPSASEYLALVGKEVMIHFACTKDIMESRRLSADVYRVVRHTIILP